MRIITITLLFFVFGYQPANSFQKSFPYVESEPTIQKGIKFHDQEKYLEAIDLYDRVYPSDSNYIWAQYEKMYSLMELEDYDLSISIGENFLHKNSFSRPQFYVALANAYDEVSQMDKALNIYDEGISLYPYKHQLHFNRGITLSRLEKWSEAEDVFKYSIALNPFHTGSHQNLGDLMIRRGQSAEATLSTVAALFISPGNNALLVKLNNFFVGEVEYANTLRSRKSNDDLDEINKLLDQKSALETDYKFDMPLDAPVVRQLHFLIHNFQYNSESENFWMITYGPILDRIQEEKLHEAFIYYLLSSTDNQGVAKWLEKKEEQLKQLYAVINESWYQFRSHSNMILPEGDMRQLWFFDSHELSAIGNEPEEDKYVGPWEFYYSNGQLQAKGLYNEEGNKEGHWIYYHSDGIISKEENYAGGELDGKTILYNDLGYKKTEITYKNATVVPPVLFFDDFGNITEELPFANEQREGKGKLFYPDGSLMTTYTYKENELHDEYIEYYPNGEVKSSSAYNLGKKDGPYEKYFYDGSIEEKGNYLNDELNDSLLAYFPNGTLQVAAYYRDGKKEGKWIYHNPNGTVEDDMTYRDDELVGIREIYDLEGQLKWKEKYNKDGLFIGFEYKDPETGEWIEETNKRGNFKVDLYDHEGNLVMKSRFLKGNKQGITKNYWPNGKLAVEVYYYKGKENGEYTSYNEKGKLDYVYELKEGIQDGFYTSYWYNGPVEAEGWVKQGNKDQMWKKYYRNGGLKSVYYYNMGNLNGQAIEYDLKERPQFIMDYEWGKLKCFQQKDSLGSTLVDIEYEIDAGEIIHKFSNGKERFSNLYVNGKQKESNLYYQNGELSYRRSTEDFIQYKLEYYYLNGNKKIEATELNGNFDGSYLMFYDNGEKAVEKHYMNGQLNGPYKTFYENGVLESEAFYVSNEKIGKAQYYDPFGELAVEKYYNSRGIEKYRYLKPDSTFTDYIDVEGNNGTIEAYFRNEKKSIHHEYELGFFGGKIENYSSNGQLIMSASFKEGNEVGETKKYYPNGNLKQVENYKDGFLHGPYISYYENGNVKSITNYQWGLKQGTYQVFDENKREIYSSFFVNDYEY